jgi:hypothetical protein
MLIGGVELLPAHLFELCTLWRGFLDDQLPAIKHGYTNFSLGYMLA